MLKTTGKILLIAVMFSGMIGTVIPQKAKQPKADPFAVVPEGRRERLKYRLAEFVEHQRKKEWEKVFEMLAEHHKNNGTPVLTKKDFLKHPPYSRVHKFTPRSVQTTPEGFGGYLITGCGNFGFLENVKAAVEAFYENGDWYFSDVNSVAPCIDCPNETCRHKMD